MKGFYLSSGYSTEAKEWNKQREIILKYILPTSFLIVSREAVLVHLYPMLERELRQFLFTEASNRYNQREMVLKIAE